MKNLVIDWQAGLAAAMTVSPLNRLFEIYGLNTLKDFPRARQLNELAHRNASNGWGGPQFIDQGQIAADESRYYEQIIAETGRVPTREDNWHDFFNAMVWLQFPRTKGLLNQLHMQDIHSHGVHPRTARRHRLTHFDECGIVLAVPGNHLEAGNRILTALARHQWQDALWTMRQHWGEAVIPAVFGHANLEMLLSPFIGLTGKWLGVVVPANYASLSRQHQMECLDSALVERIHRLDGMARAQILRPLPILGVPGWHGGQNPEFYRNTGYFRPQRAGVPMTCQLPLS